MSKIVADNLKQISVYKLREWGLFKPEVWTTMNTGTITWTSSFAGESRVTGKVLYRIEYVSGKPTKLWLDYQIVDSKETREYHVNLVTTQCNYGKERYWLQCGIYKNGQYCGRRVAKLYLYNTYFCCRYCLDLTYESNNRTRSYRALDTVFGTDYQRKLEKQLENTGRYYYAGKLTKKAEKLLELRIRQNIDAEAWLAAGAKF